MDVFIQHAVQKVGVGNHIYCLCLHCDNKSLYPIREVKGHLYFNSINSSYQRGILHGEDANSLTSGNFNGATIGVEIDDNDDVVSMVNGIEEDLVDRHEQFERLLGDAEKSLYFGCTNNFKNLFAIVHLYNLKADNGWSDKSFLELLKFLAKMLPQPNELPMSMYEVKKAISYLGMGYEKIHACRKNCVRYSGYGIGGYNYNTCDHDLRSTTHNNSVMVEAKSLHMSIANDKNPIYSNM